MYDFNTGRFFGLDPIADEFQHVSPYNYTENEPAGSIDLWGLQRWKVNGKERNKPSSDYLKRASTAGTAIRYPVAAAKVGENGYGKTNVSSIAGRVGRHIREDAGLSMGAGKEENAFIHTIWSAKLAAEFGSNTATDLADAHEGVGVASVSEIDLNEPFEVDNDVEGAELADHVVDLLNNEVGRAIGEPMGEGASFQRIALKALMVFMVDGLWVSEVNPIIKLLLKSQKLRKSNLKRHFNLSVL